MIGMSFVVSSPAVFAMYLPCPCRPSQIFSVSLNSHPWSIIQSIASAAPSHQILTRDGSAVPSETSMAFSNMSSALSVTSSKFCGIASEDVGAQYWTVALVAPPMRSAFSTMTTSDPSSIAVTAAATPAAPEPTTTISVSRSHVSPSALVPFSLEHPGSMLAPMIPAAPMLAAVRNERRDTPDSFAIDLPIISLLVRAAYAAYWKLSPIRHDACRTKRMSIAMKGMGQREATKKGPAEADP